MNHYQDTFIETASGRPRPGVDVTVLRSSDGQAASIFSDANGTRRHNPVSTDSNGRFSFYAEDGCYDFSFSVKGTQIGVQHNVQICTGLNAAGRQAAGVENAIGDSESAEPSQRAVRSPPTALLDTILAAQTPAELVASTKAYATGSFLRTSNGYVYTVVAADDADYHVTTQGGTRLRIVGPDFHLAALALPGDGTDVTDAIRRILNSANSANGSVIGDGRRHRVIGGGANRININRSGKRSLRIDLRGSTIFLDDAEIWFTASGNGNPVSHLSTTLSGDVAKGSKVLPMASAAGLAEGDLIQIESPAHSFGNVPTFHSYIVEKIDGGTVYIRGGFVADITAKQVSDSGMSGNIAIQAFKMVSGLIIENGRIEHTDPNGLRVGINLTQQDSPVVRNMQFDGHTRAQLQVVYGNDDLVTGCGFRRAGYVSEIEPEATNPAAPDGLPFGYGLAHARNYRSTVSDCSSALCWHGYDAARGQMYIDYVECAGHRDAYTFATHESSWNVVYRGCKSIGRMGFTLARSVHPKLESCSGGIDGATTTNFIGLDRSSNTVTINNCAFSASGAGHINVSANSGTPRPGTVSVGDGFAWTLQNVDFRGPAPVTFGGNSSQTIIKECDFLDGAVIASANGRSVEVETVLFSGPHTQFSITLSHGVSATVSNVSSITPASTGSSALIAVVGIPASLDVSNCETASEYLIRVLEASGQVRINTVSGGKAGRILLGGPNVILANVVNTKRRFPQLVLGGATVTQSMNNIQLTK